MQIFVQKALKYQKNPDLGGYLDKFLLLGEVLFDVDWTRNQLNLVPPCGSLQQHPALPVSAWMEPRTASRWPRCCDGATDLTMTPIELYEWYEFWRAEGRNRAPYIEKKDDVVARLNEGSAIIHHVGHGDRDRMSIGGTAGGGAIPGERCESA